VRKKEADKKKFFIKNVKKQVRYGYKWSICNRQYCAVCFSNLKKGDGMLFMVLFSSFLQKLFRTIVLLLLDQLFQLQ
jgi:hypothetical protein